MALCCVISLKSLRNTKMSFPSPKRSQFSPFFGDYELSLGHWSTVYTLFSRTGTYVMQMSANVKAKSTNNIKKMQEIRCSWHKLSALFNPYLNKVIIANLLVLLVTNNGLLPDQHEVGIIVPHAWRILIFSEEGQLPSPGFYTNCVSLSGQLLTCMCQFNLLRRKHTSFLGNYFDNHSSCV